MVKKQSLGENSSRENVTHIRNNKNGNEASTGRYGSTIWKWQLFGRIII